MHNFRGESKLLRRFYIVQFHFGYHRLLKTYVTFKKVPVCGDKSRKYWPASMLGSPEISFLDQDM